MAYYPKNKAKVKPSKEGDFIYLDDQTPFNGNYIQTSKGQYYEGDDINSPGRVIIPTQRRQRKNQLLSLLKNLLLNLFNSALIQQLLNELLSTLLNPGDIFNMEQLLEILDNAKGRNLTEEEKNRAQELLNQVESDDIEGLDNSVINSSIYNNLKPSIYNRLNNNESPIATKIKPLDSDYNKGSYIRYFAKRNNSLSDFFEINEATYNSIDQEKVQFDVNLYQSYSIRWALGEDAENVNTSTLSRYERSLPGIKTLFNDPAEYTRAPKINLYTEGNELYYEDGTEYIGEYHIHPIEGPMVGATHVQEQHDKLYYSYELGTFKDESDPEIITPEVPQIGLFRTIGNNEFYIRQNKFGIFAEVVDTLTTPPSVVYTSEIYLKSEITSEELIELTVVEFYNTLKVSTITLKGDENFNENTAASMAIDLDLLNSLTAPKPPQPEVSVNLSPQEVETEESPTIDVNLDTLEYNSPTSNQLVANGDIKVKYKKYVKRTGRGNSGFKFQKYVELNEEIPRTYVKRGRGKGYYLGTDDLRKDGAKYEFIEYIFA